MGLINIPPVENGDANDENLYNSRFAPIVDEINGNLDSDNLATNAITTPKITNGAVTNAKLDTSVGGLGGEWADWTPTITPTSGTFTTTSASGRWTQVGKTVHFNTTITVTTVGSGSGLQFSLPATADSSNKTIGGYRERAVGGSTGVVVLSSTSNARLNEYDNTQTIANGWVFECYGTYEAA